MNSRNAINFLFLIVLLIFDRTQYLYSQEVPSEDSQLRRFENDLNKAPEPTATQKESEDEWNKKSKQREWRRRHPGEPLPAYLEEDVDEGILDLFLSELFKSPFTLPYVALEDNFDRPYWFQPYPFATGKGLLKEGQGRRWLANGKVTAQRVSHGLWGYRAEVEVMNNRRWGTELAYTHYREQLKTRKEYLSMGEGLVTYSFAQSPCWQFRTGFGLQRIQGRETTYGGKWVYRVSNFIKPIQVNLNLGMTLGLDMAPLWEVAPSVGFHSKRLEFTVGYRHNKTSHEQISGPEFGFRYWF